MPLVTCRDCGRQHSDAAAACPGCARPHRVYQQPQQDTAREVARGIRSREAAHALSSVVMGLSLLLGLVVSIAVAPGFGLIVVIIGLVGGMWVRWSD